MFAMVVSDVFYIRGRGLVATGRVDYGELSVGDQVQINDGQRVSVDAIEAFRKVVDTARAGDNVGLRFSTLTKSDIASGDLIKSAGVFLA